MKRNLRILIITVGFVISQSSLAELEVGSGGGSCTPLVTTIKMRWSDVKNHMLPSNARLQTPESEHFICIPPGVTQRATPRLSPANGEFSFFSAPFSKGLGIVCDRRLTSCAQLNPGLFPELQPKRQEQEYEPPKSNWVKPPSDGDQWGTN